MLLATANYKASIHPIAGGKVAEPVERPYQAPCVTYGDTMRDDKGRFCKATKSSVGDVVTINGRTGTWKVEVVEPFRCCCVMEFKGFYAMHWAKPEQMKKVDVQVTPKIIPGSVVRLRSGGPEMTVQEGADSKGLVDCLYYVDSCLVRRVFPSSTLEFVR